VGIVGEGGGRSGEGRAVGVIMGNELGGGERGVGKRDWRGGVGREGRK